MTYEDFDLKQKLFELQKRNLRIWKNAEAWKDSKWWYKYATLDKIWDEISSIMEELGIVESSAIKYNDVWKVFVHTTIYNTHDTKDYMSSQFPLDDTLSPQDMWKVITYWRRYNLVALLNLKIVWEDDDAQGVGSKKKAAPNWDKFVDNVVDNKNLDKAKVLMDKINDGEYEVSNSKFDKLSHFINSNLE